MKIDKKIGPLKIATILAQLNQEFGAVSRSRGQRNNSTIDCPQLPESC